MKRMLMGRKSISLLIFFISFFKGAHNNNLSKDNIEKVKDSSIKLLGVLATILGISHPVSAAWLAVGLVAYQEILGGDPTDPDRLWNKLEEKVDTKIGQTLSAHRLHQLKQDVLYPLNRRAAKGERFKSEDLEEILDRMSSVMPLNPTYEWHYDLGLPMVYYLPIMISGYQQLIFKGDVHPCSLANDMELFRRKAIRGLREMFRLRYKAIKGKTTSASQIPCSSFGKRSSIHSRGFGYIGSCTKTVKNVVYEDTATSTTFTCSAREAPHEKDTILPGKSFQDKINKIRDDTADFLMKEIVGKLNQMYTPEICLGTIGCSCPQKITRKDILVTYPRSCYGENCIFPAARFGKRYTWCYMIEKDVKWTGSTDRKTLNRIDLDTCLNISNVEYKQLNDIPP